MKILQVTQFFSPTFGGSAVNPYLLSKELAKRGHEITIYTSDYQLSEEWIMSAKQLQIEVLPFDTWLHWVNFQVTPGLSQKAGREIKYFDIIHLHNFRTFQNIVIRHYAMRYNIPYILQAHGSVATFFEKKILKNTFDKLWGYRILNNASKVIAVTEMEAEQYKSMGIHKDKIEIVPNGIDLSEFENLPQRGEFRRKYGLDAEQKIILYLGRIHKIKGLDLLVKAFADISHRFNDTKLVIAGPDDLYLSSLNKLIGELKISDKVLFTGPLHGQEKLKAYVDADIYVLPSFYEIFGITILEACACGTPVIVTDRCGIADVIDSEVGLVVTYDKEQLQRALFEMLGNDKKRQEFGEKGKLVMGEKFNWEKIAEQMERIYWTAFL